MEWNGGEKRSQEQTNCNIYRILFSHIYFIIIYVEILNRIELYLEKYHAYILCFYFFIDAKHVFRVQ